MNYKIYFGFFSFVPQKCCGIEAGVGAALVTGGAGVISNIMTNESNADLNASNLRFSAQQAEKQRQFQKDEWTRQYQLQRDEWYKQLNAQSEQQWLNFMREANYNSPVEQSKRLAQAGLNPSALLGGQGSSGLVSAATGNVHSSPNPSVPSGGTVSGASASAPSMIPMRNPLDGSLSSIGAFIRDIAEANKNDKTVQPFVELLGQQILSQKLQNEWQTFENEILSKTKDVKVRQAFRNLKLTGVEIGLKQALTGQVDTQSALNEAEKALAIAKEKCSNQEYEQLSFAVTHLMETWSTQMELYRSQTANNNASAFYNTAMGVTENELRQFRVDNAKLINEYQDYVNRMNSNEADISDWTKNERFGSVLNELVENAARQGLITQKLRQDLEKARQDNEYYIINHVLGPILGIGTAATVISGGLPASRPKIGFTR